MLAKYLYDKKFSSEMFIILSVCYQNYFGGGVRDRKRGYARSS